MCFVAQESSEEESNEEKDEEVVVEKDVQVMAEEKLEKVNLGSNPWELTTISINSRLSGEIRIDIVFERVQRCLHMGLQ